MEFIRAAAEHHFFPPCRDSLVPEAQAHEARGAGGSRRKRAACAPAGQGHIGGNRVAHDLEKYGAAHALHAVLAQKHLKKLVQHGGAANR